MVAHLANERDLSAIRAVQLAQLEMVHLLNSWGQQKNHKLTLKSQTRATHFTVWKSACEKDVLCGSGRDLTSVRK